MSKPQSPPDAAPVVAPAAPGAMPDAWIDLRALTAARIALGRSGASLPTDEVLRFDHAHAQARDAVHLAFDADAFARACRKAGFATVRVASAAPDRATYLLCPDLGRRLSEASAAELREVASHESARDTPDPELLFVVGDGLSALAVARHALALLEAVRERIDPRTAPGPVVIATQARVALGDEIGAIFRARMVAVLIGERPGLSSPDSLGVYLTYAPRVGRSDAERNCISNVRPEGLAYAQAAHRLAWLVREAQRLQASGIVLKDRSDEAAHDALPAPWR